MLKAVLFAACKAPSYCARDLSAHGVLARELDELETTKPDTIEEELDRSLRECDVLPYECIVVAKKAEILKAARRCGSKCVGFSSRRQETRSNGTKSPSQKKNDDLFGCCEYLLESWDDVDYAYFQRVYLRLEGLPLIVSQTENLLLRELTEADIPALCRIMTEASVREFTDGICDDLLQEEEKQRAYIAQAYRFYEYGYWGVFDKLSQNLIGRCGIQDTLVDGASEIELGYFLSEAYRGKGYAKEAVRAVLRYALITLGLTRVVAVIDKRNEASLCVAKQCGMRYEKDMIRNGRSCVLLYIDSESMGIRG